jgi:hypothetical protein
MFLSFIILETDRTSLVVDQWPMQFSTALRQEAARVARHTLEEVQLQDIEIGWFDASKDNNLFKSARITNVGHSHPSRIGCRIMNYKLI